jgi:hypothetical protein
MPEHRNSAGYRLTIRLKLEADPRAEVLRLDCSGGHSGNSTLTGTPGFSEAFQLCVDRLIGDGLLPPWKL